ncbi:MAG: hypothetical protein ACKOEW_09075 [Methylocystis sp.]
MKTFWIKRLSVGLALAALSSSSPTWASDDKSTVKAVTDMVGITSDQPQEKIDYSERPKLVMPPKTDFLPAPRDRTAERPPDWPADAAVGVRRTDRFARDPNAPPEKPRPPVMERIRGARENTGAGADDEPGLFQRMLMVRQKAAENEVDEPVRKVLAEPPNGLRHPTQELSKVKDTSKKTGFLGSIFGGGSGSDNDPVAQTAGTSVEIEKPKTVEVPDEQKSKSFTSKLKSYLPGFMKGSETN